MNGTRAAIVVCLCGLAGFPSAGSPAQGGDGPAEILGLQPDESATESDLVFPGAEPLNELGFPAMLVVRLEDEASGAPIPSGAVAVFREATYTAETTWPPIRTAPADDSGFVRLRIDDLRAAGTFWLAFDAPGYAPVFVMNQPDDTVVALRHGVAVPVFVRDDFDRPVAGCRVGLVLGCGHTPDARSAVTDESGLAVLENVTPGLGEIWPVASGFESSYFPFGPHLPGEPPVPVRLRRSADARGIVLDASGPVEKPLAGVLVGAPHCHRGPYVRTGPDGRFHLVGAESGASELHLVFGDGREASASRAPEGVDRILRVGAIDPDEPRGFVDFEDEPAYPVALDVTIGDSGIEDDDEAIRVTAVRAGDGLTVTESIDDDEPHEIRLPAGTYSVTAEGGDLSAGRATAALEVTNDGKPRRVTIDLPEFRRVAARYANPPDDLTITLHSPGGERDVTDVVLGGETVPIPSPGPVAFRLESGSRSIRAVAPAEGGRLFDLPRIPSARVGAKLVGSDGREPASARVAVSHDPDADIGDVGATDRADVETRLVGSAYFVAETAVGRGEAVSRIAIPIRIPAEPGATIDLGTIELPPRTPGLRARLLDGSPAAGAIASIERAGVSARSRLDSRGAWVGSVVPVAGDRVVISDPTEARLPIRATLEGQAPFVLDWPGASIRVTVTDEGGRPLDGGAVVVVRGRPIEVSSGTARIGGLAAGEETLTVAARGRRAVTIVLRLAPAESREIAVRLGPNR